MVLFDRKIGRKWKNYLWQSGIAILAIFLILFIFTKITNLIILAAVGASTFTVFAIPKDYTARARNVMGGHLIGCCMGVLCFHLFSPLLIGGSLAVGATMLLMIITNTEHPPAAGTALGLVVSGSVGGVIFITGSAFGLSLIKRLMDPWLENLTG